MPPPVCERIHCGHGCSQEGASWLRELLMHLLSPCGSFPVVSWGSRVSGSACGGAGESLRPPSLPP